MEMSSIDEKLDRIQKAFKKAIDESVNSIGEQDLAECCQDTKQALGAHLQRSFVNMIALVETKVGEGFAGLVDEYKIKELVENISMAPTIKDNEGLRDDVDGMKDLLNKVKKAEIVDLQNAIKSLEAEIKKSKDMGGRLRTQMINEVEALNEENLKIKNAAAIGMEQPTL